MILTFVCFILLLIVTFKHVYMCKQVNQLSVVQYIRLRVAE